jgi:hypothetical protein
MPEATAYVYFGLRGDFDPEALASGISIAPDKCMAKHSRSALHRMPRHSILNYGTVETFAAFIDVYDLAERCVEKLEPHLDALVAAITLHGAHCVLEVVVHLPESPEVSLPALGFSQRVIQFTAAAGASIDVDCYRG